jgi:UDP-2,3-diacylglucosamine pyrophosphatase LpxH
MARRPRGSADGAQPAPVVYLLTRAVLAFISDLHISDRTAGAHFLSARAFEQAFRRLAALADRSRSNAITIVFLGDVFEMVRTTRWLGDHAATPWAVPRDHARTAATALEVMDRIAHGDPENVRIFDILSGSLQQRYGFAVEPARVFVPGNHDRICNEYPRLRERVAELLGMREHNPPELRPDFDTPYRHAYVDEAYGVLAAHGHEFDSLSFEGDRSVGIMNLRPEDYLEVPVSEVIAAEIAARLPVQIGAALEGKVEESVRRRVLARLHSVDDVRPLPAIVPWLFELSDEIEHGRRRDVRRTIERVVEWELRAIFERFRHLPYMVQWQERNRSLLPWSKANQVRAVVWMLRMIGLSTLRRYLGWGEAVYRRLYEGDNLTKAATGVFEQFAEDPQRADILYTIFGHTHKAAQIPIGQGQGVDRRPRIYLNSGTWRALAQLGVTGSGFMSWTNLNLTVLYQPDHDPGSQAARAGYPTFETVLGSVLDPELQVIP